MIVQNLKQLLTICLEVNALRDDTPGDGHEGFQKVAETKFAFRGRQFPISDPRKISEKTSSQYFFCRTCSSVKK